MGQALGGCWPRGPRHVLCLSEKIRRLLLLEERAAWGQLQILLLELQVCTGVQLPASLQAVGEAARLAWALFVPV